MKRNSIGDDIKQQRTLNPLMYGCGVVPGWSTNMNTKKNYNNKSKNNTCIFNKKKCPLIRCWFLLLGKEVLYGTVETMKLTLGSL